MQILFHSKKKLGNSLIKINLIEDDIYSSEVLINYALRG